MSLARMFDLFSRDAQRPIDLTDAPDDAGAARIRARATELLNVTRRVQRTKELLEAMEARKTHLETVVLPNLMDSVQVDTIGLPAAGADIVVDNYCQASISVDAEPEWRDRAFVYLEELGGGDLLRATVSVAFPKEDIGLARKLQKAAESWLRVAAGNETPPPVALDMTVHHSTLSAWLRKEIAARQSAAADGETVVPIDYSRIGARVGRVVKIRARKEKKAGGRRK